MDRKLKVGRISFINILPVCRALEASPDAGAYEFVESYPAHLNALLRQGALDISPSSSIEYLRDPDSYGYIAGNSISARGAIKSILLISSSPISELGGKRIALTHQSETSSALLKVILEKFYSIHSEYTVTQSPMNEALHQYDAYLTIGDDALVAAERAGIISMEKKVDGGKVTLPCGEFFAYDLAELWWAHTGLPTVFALWVYRKSITSESPGSLEAFTALLNTAREKACQGLEALAKSESLIISPQSALQYWRAIEYGLDHECIKGLELYGRYLREMSLI